MAATTDADPVRERVEAALHRVVGGVMSLPCELVRGARQTLAEPVALARSMVSLTLSGILGLNVDGGKAPRAGAAADPAAPPLDREADVSEAGPATSQPSPAADLAIPDYDHLAASQVVARLGGLERDELKAIREFELAHRGRRTIVGKVDQLLATR
jgi:hypothetical protein